MIRSELSPQPLSGHGSMSPPRTSCDLNLNFQSAFAAFRGSLVSYSPWSPPSRPSEDIRASHLRKPLQAGSRNRRSIHDLASPYGATRVLYSNPIGAAAQGVARKISRHSALEDGGGRDGGGRIVTHRLLGGHVRRAAPGEYGAATVPSASCGRPSNEARAGRAAPRGVGGARLPAAGLPGFQAAGGRPSMTNAAPWREAAVVRSYAHSGMPGVGIEPTTCRLRVGCSAN